MQALTDPQKIISIMRVMLSELENILSTAPERTNESTRTDQLQSQIDRMDAVLKKSQAVDRHRKEIERQNKANARSTKSR